MNTNLKRFDCDSSAIQFIEHSQSRECAHPLVETHHYFVKFKKSKRHNDTKIIKCKMTDMVINLFVGPPFVVRITSITYVRTCIFPSSHKSS